MLNYLAWILVLVIYSPAFYLLYIKGGSRYWNDDYSHACFILPIALWLIWRKRKSLLQEVKRKNKEPAQGTISLFILVFGVLMFIFGWRQDVYFVYLLSMVPVVFGLAGFLYGSGILKVIAFPVFYLLFIVPPPVSILDSITVPMRYGTSFAAEWVLNLLNYPVSRDGLLLSIGYRDIFMAPACSGFRSLLTMFALVLVYVYITKGGLGKKLILVAFITPLALLGNLIRVLTLCLITFYFSAEAGQGFFHNFSGIVIFVFTISGLMGVELIVDKLLPENRVDIHDE